MSNFSLTDIEFDPVRPQAYSTDIIKAFLSKELYSSVFTWDSERNRRSTKVRLPLVLQDIIIEVARPVLKKNKVPMKDFLARVRKRFSSSLSKKDKLEAEKQKKTSKKTEESPAGDMSPVMNRAYCGSKESAEKQDLDLSLYRPKKRATQQVDTASEEASDDEAGRHSPKRVRTPGTSLSDSDGQGEDGHYEDELGRDSANDAAEDIGQNERALARQSVMNYLKRRAAELNQSEHEEDESQSSSAEELVYSSDEV